MDALSGSENKSLGRFENIEIRAELKQISLAATTEEICHLSFPPAICSYLNLGVRVGGNRKKGV